jgi:hypothetical protein
MSELVTIELTDAERRLMHLAINEYSGLAKYGKPLLTPLFGASTIDEFDATLHQLRSEVENSDPLSDLDWARAAVDRNRLGKRSARRRHRIRNQHRRRHGAPAAALTAVQDQQCQTSAAAHRQRATHRHPRDQVTARRIPAKRINGRWAASASASATSRPLDFNLNRSANGEDLTQPRPARFGVVVRRGIETHCRSSP